MAPYDWTVPGWFIPQDLVKFTEANALYSVICLARQGSLAVTALAFDASDGYREPVTRRTSICLVMVPCASRDVKAVTAITRYFGGGGWVGQMKMSGQERRFETPFQTEIPMISRACHTFNLTPSSS